MRRPDTPAQPRGGRSRCGSRLAASLPFTRQAARLLLLTSLLVCVSVLVYLLALQTGYPGLWRPASYSTRRRHPALVLTRSLLTNVSSSDLKALRRLAQPCTGNMTAHIKTRNDVWYVMTGPGRHDEINVFSAHVDDRMADDTYLRLFTVTMAASDVTVYCQLWYHGVSHAVVTSAEGVDRGRGLRHRGMFYVERVYTCPLPRLAAVPVGVSMVFSKCSRATSVVPVQVPERPAHMLEVGVCVAVAYGYLRPKQLIEWVELNRILGVSEINVYDSRINKQAVEVLRYYQNQSTVRLQMAAPPVHDWCHWCQKISTIPVINDCMYRNMYRYKYLMVIDFDEFVIPHSGRFRQLSASLDDLEQGGRIPQAAFMIRNAYFFLDFPPQEQEGKDLVSMRYQTRLPASATGYAPKSVINPRKCIVMQNHYCMERTLDVGTAWTLSVAEDKLLLHHYKHCHFGTEACAEKMRTSHQDNTTLRYKQELVARVQEAFRAFGFT